MCQYNLKRLRDQESGRIVRTPITAYKVVCPVSIEEGIFFNMFYDTEKPFQLGRKYRARTLNTPYSNERHFSPGFHAFASLDRAKRFCTLGQAVVKVRLWRKLRTNGEHSFSWHPPRSIVVGRRMLPELFVWAEPLEGSASGA